MRCEYQRRGRLPSGECTVPWAAVAGPGPRLAGQRCVSGTGDRAPRASGPPRTGGVDEPNRSSTEAETSRRSRLAVTKAGESDAHRLGRRADTPRRTSRQAGRQAGRRPGTAVAATACDVGPWVTLPPPAGCPPCPAREGAGAAAHATYIIAVRATAMHACKTPPPPPTGQYSASNVCGHHECLRTLDSTVGLRESS